MTDEIMVPMAILGGALLLYVGFFKAAQEWIQSRVGGKGTTAAKSGPPESLANPKQEPPPGSSPQGPQLTA